MVVRDFEWVCIAKNLSMQHHKNIYKRLCQYLNMVHLNEDYQYFNKINLSYTGIRVVNRKDCEILNFKSSQ